MEMRWIPARPRLPLALCRRFVLLWRGRAEV
jgi:hypothetical protein